ncbi:MAG: hypothetical protein AAFX02_09875 [Pseudomonadota bacterium]
MVLALILLYVFGQIALAAWAGRGASDEADYLVAGRKLGVFAVGMSVFATWFASESLLATSAEVAETGLAGARAEPFAYGVGIIAIGLFFAHKLRAAGHLSIADFIRVHFGDVPELLSAGIIALSATFWAGAQLFAFATIIASASPLSFELSLAAATGLVLVYTLFGGLAGDVITDVVQGTIVIITMIGLFWLMIDAFGGISAAIEATPKAAWSIAGTNEKWFDGLELWLIPIVGTMVSQEALSRALGANSPQTARKGALLGAGIYISIGLIPIAFGLFGPQLAAELGVSLGAGDAFLPSLAEALFPSWLYIIFTGALLSAILSSVDSALLAVSAVATDSGLKRVAPNASPRIRLRAARLTTLGAALLAAAIALLGDGLRELVLTASAVAAVLAIPMVLALAGWRGGGRTAATAIIAQILALGALDWVLGVDGAFLWMLLVGAMVFAIGLPLERFGRSRIESGV